MTETAKRRMRELADNVLVIALARGMSIFGVPIAILLVGWAGSEFLAMRSSLARLDDRLNFAVIRQLDDHDRRIVRLEVRGMRP